MIDIVLRGGPLEGKMLRATKALFEHGELSLLDSKPPSIANYVTKDAAPSWQPHFIIHLYRRPKYGNQHNWNYAGTKDNT